MGRTINRQADYKVARIAVIGPGGVGKCFLNQLEALIKRYSSTPSSPDLSLVLVARSSKVLYSPDYSSLDISSWESQLSSSSQSPLSVSEIIDYLVKSPEDGIVILVDNTSSQDLAEQYPAILSAGINIVTPNKKAFSGSYELFQSIKSAASQSGAVYYHESSVGAGLPILTTLKDIIGTGATVTKIEGVFSGTMSFLFNSFAPADGQGGGKWSAEVSKAKALGYTEPDPRDDLNGLDVARKLTILARLSGLKIESATSFPVQSLIPKELESAASGDEFLAHLPEFDSQMDKIKTDAEAQGKVVRFVGSIDVPTQKLQVGLQMFDKSHPIASIKGSDNIISFYMEGYSSPIVIQGAGAGGDFTAMGVLADLLRVVERLM